MVEEMYENKCIYSPSQKSFPFLSLFFFFWIVEGSDQYLVLHSVLHGELYSMLCGDLDEKEIQKGREYMYTYGGFILVYSRS